MWFLRDFQHEWIFQDFSQQTRRGKITRYSEEIASVSPPNKLDIFISNGNHLLSAHKNACVLLQACVKQIVWVLLYIFVISDKYAACRWSNHTTSADVSPTLRGTSTVTFQESLATFQHNLGSPYEFEYLQLNQV